MAYSWDNRVKFVVRYMYDIDNNGYLDKNDFECLALKATIVESRGEYSASKFQENQKIMQNLWNEIAELADFNKDGVVTVDEFKAAVKQTCVTKTYAQFPQAMKMFIDTYFKTVDINGDGEVSVEEFKMAVKNSCLGKKYSDFPSAMRGFIDSTFRSCDINGDGVIGPEEFRVDCVSRSAFSNIEDIDSAFQKLLNDDDKKRGGINLARYQELYAQFLGDANEKNPANWLFGPLNELS